MPYVWQFGNGDKTAIWGNFQSPASPVDIAAFATLPIISWEKTFAFFGCVWANLDAALQSADNILFWFWPLQDCDKFMTIFSNVLTNQWQLSVSQSYLGSPLVNGLVHSASVATRPPSKINIATSEEIAGCYFLHTQLDSDETKNGLLLTIVIHPRIDACKRFNDWEVFPRKLQKSTRIQWIHEYNSRRIRTGPIPFRRCVSTTSASSTITSSSSPSSATTMFTSMTWRRMVKAIHHSVWGPKVRGRATKIAIASFRVSGGTFKLGGLQSEHCNDSWSIIFFGY